MTDFRTVDNLLSVAPTSSRSVIAWYRVAHGISTNRDRQNVADALYRKAPPADVDAAWIRIVAADRARTGEIDPTTEPSAVLCYLAETPTVTAAALVREGICATMQQAYGAIGAEVKKGRVVKVGDGVYGLA
jgi:hypothetical protein